MSDFNESLSISYFLRDKDGIRICPRGGLVEAQWLSTKRCIRRPLSQDFSLGFWFGAGARYS